MVLGVVLRVCWPSRTIGPPKTAWLWDSSKDGMALGLGFLLPRGEWAGFVNELVKGVGCASFSMAGAVSLSSCTGAGAS